MFLVALAFQNTFEYMAILFKTHPLGVGLFFQFAKDGTYGI